MDYTTEETLVGQFDIEELTTEAGASDALVSLTHNDYKYVQSLGGWYVWNGVRWELDNNAIWHEVKEFGQHYLEEAIKSDKATGDRLYKYGRHLLSGNGARHVITWAERDARVVRKPADFDRDIYLLNTLSGTVDLRTGELLPHKRDDLITRITGVAYVPGASSGKWNTFLKTVLEDDELRGFFQRALGYSATGDVREDCFFIMQGPGGNGKGTAIETITAALGDYAHRTQTDMLMMKPVNATAATPNVADLKSRRFVFASESEEGHRLAESLVKDLTGGDTINARWLNQNPFTFTPTHKLWLQTNHAPQIRGQDPGMWRRIKKLPFTVRPKKPDTTLRAKLKNEDELKGVLAWIINGAVSWYKNGLQEPEVVSKSTKEYKESQDKIGTFIEEECKFTPTGIVGVSELYQAYKTWCVDNGEYVEKNRRFTTALLEREGIWKDKATKGEYKDKHIYIGIEFKG